MSVCLCLLRDGEYSSTLQSAGSTLPSAGSTYANLGYTSTRSIVHVYMSACYTGAYFWVNMRRSSKCACVHVAKWSFSDVHMRTCTTKTRFMWTRRQKRDPSEKKTSHSNTHGRKIQKRLKCVHAYMRTCSKKSQPKIV